MNEGYSIEEPAHGCIQASYGTIGLSDLPAFIRFDLGRNFAPVLPNATTVHQPDPPFEVFNCRCAPD